MDTQSRTVATRARGGTLSGASWWRWELRLRGGWRVGGKGSEEPARTSGGLGVVTVSGPETGSGTAEGGTDGTAGGVTTPTQWRLDR